MTDDEATAEVERLDAEAKKIAEGSASDWSWAMDVVPSMAEANRRRREAGELGTKRHWAASWTSQFGGLTIISMTTILRSFLLGVLCAAFWSCMALFTATIDAAVLPIAVLGAERSASGVFFTFQIALAAAVMSSLILGATVRRAT